MSHRINNIFFPTRNLHLATAPDRTTRYPPVASIPTAPYPIPYSESITSATSVPPRFHDSLCLPKPGLGSGHLQRYILTECPTTLSRISSRDSRDSRDRDCDRSRRQHDLYPQHVLNSRML